jgi:hypothetical protein
MSDSRHSVKKKMSKIELAKDRDFVGGEPGGFLLADKLFSLWSD